MREFKEETGGIFAQKFIDSLTASIKGYVIEIIHQMGRSLIHSRHQAKEPEVLERGGQVVVLHRPRAL